MTNSQPIGILEKKYVLNEYYLLITINLLLNPAEVRISIKFQNYIKLCFSKYHTFNDLMIH